MIEPTKKAVFFLEGDENAYEYQTGIIEFQGREWLVLSWLLENATGERVPEWIAPMDKVPHVVEPNGLVTLGLLMPRQLHGSLLLRQLDAVQYLLLADSHQHGNIH